MRLIDADALMKAIKADDVAWRFGVPNTLRLLFDHLRIIINEQPTADAVEVVRCKDCKFYHDKGYCTKITGLTRIKPDDFCSYGERKDNG